MKTILYATDYSENSVAALRLAHLLAKKLEAKLVVLHVFDIPISLASPVSVSYMNKEQKLFVENRAKLRKFFYEHLADAREEDDINFVVDEHGSVTDGILENAVKFDVDMVVLGTKGASQIRELILGSTTKAIIRKSSCAVLAVPPMFDAMDFKTIAYATDFEQADIFAIKRLVKIAEKFNAQIRVVHITTQKEYAGDQQMEWFKGMLRQKIAYEIMDFDLIFSDAVVEELNWYLKDSGSNLLAMLERGQDRGLFHKLFHKDIVLKMEERDNHSLAKF